jgi:hypothetical protein
VQLALVHNETRVSTAIGQCHKQVEQAAPQAIVGYAAGQGAELVGAEPALQAAQGHPITALVHVATPEIPWYLSPGVDAITNKADQSFNKGVAAIPQGPYSGGYLAPAIQQSQDFRNH